MKAQHFKTFSEVGKDSMYPSTTATKLLHCVFVEMHHPATRQFSVSAAIYKVMTGNHQQDDLNKHTQ